MKSFLAETVLGFGSFLVTPSDNDLIEGGYSRGLIIGTGGIINVTFPDGTEADGMPAPEGVFPFFVKKVRAGGTAADIWTVV